MIACFKEGDDLKVVIPSGVRSGQAVSPKENTTYQEIVVIPSGVRSGQARKLDGLGMIGK